MSSFTRETLRALSRGHHPRPQRRGVVTKPDVYVGLRDHAGEDGIREQRMPARAEPAVAAGTLLVRR